MPGTDTPGPVLLIGARLADGSGGPLRDADVLLDGHMIRAVSPPGQLTTPAAEVRDLTGLVLAPGFIDVHSHADNAPLLAWDDTTKIRQGVTTEVVGNCGFSLAPHSSAHGAVLAEFTQRIFPPLDFGWHRFDELFAVTDSAGYVTNQCPLAGHGTLRIATLGMADRAPDTGELHVMRTTLAEALEAGAFGLSSGLIYPPATFAETDEMVALAETLGPDGLYVTHMRDEGDGLAEAITEALRIGAAAGRTHISHLKASGKANWGRMPHALAALRTARDSGREVSQDVYPYTASSTMLTAMLPRHFLAGDAAAVLARLTDPGERDALAAACEGTDWQDVLVATTASHRYEGLTLAEIADEHRYSGVDALIDVLVAEQLRASMVVFSMHEDDLRLALADEHTCLGSDGLPPGIGGKPHPRLFGTFPRVLGRYCRQRGVLELPEAVRRMTSLPARTFRIPDRGMVAPGYVADLVAFDPETVTDVGDYRDPDHPPAGIEWVCLGGRTVLADGDYLGGRHGRRLRPAS